MCRGSIISGRGRRTDLSPFVKNHESNREKGNLIYLSKRRGRRLSHVYYMEGSRSLPKGALRTRVVREDPNSRLRKGKIAEKGLKGEGLKSGKGFRQIQRLLSWGRTITGSAYYMEPNS